VFSFTGRRRGWQYSSPSHLTVTSCWGERAVYSFKGSSKGGNALLHTLQVVVRVGSALLRTLHVRAGTGSVLQHTLQVGAEVGTGQCTPITPYR
jgi:hypothetical protein